MDGAGVWASPCFVTSIYSIFSWYWQYYRPTARPPQHYHWHEPSNQKRNWELYHNHWWKEKLYYADENKMLIKQSSKVEAAVSVNWFFCRQGRFAESSQFIRARNHSLKRYSIMWHQYFGVFLVALTTFNQSCERFQNMNSYVLNFEKQQIKENKPEANQIH